MPFRGLLSTISTEISSLPVPDLIQAGDVADIVEHVFNHAVFIKNRRNHPALRAAHCPKNGFLSVKGAASLALKHNVLYPRW